MKKYKIRVRVLPENICCGFIVNGNTLWDAYEKFSNIMAEWIFIDFETLSIGEL